MLMTISNEAHTFLRHRSGFLYFSCNGILIVDFIFSAQLVDTTVELANKVGPSEIINRVVDDLKDENEQYRKMVMETIEKVQ